MCIRKKMDNWTLLSACLMFARRLAEVQGQAIEGVGLENRKMDEKKRHVCKVKKKKKNKKEMSKREK